MGDYFKNKILTDAERAECEAYVKKLADDSDSVDDSDLSEDSDDNIPKDAKLAENEANLKK